MAGLSVATAQTSECSDPAGAVAIVASAGGIDALFRLLEVLPPDFAIPIFIAQHLARSMPSVLPALLERRTAMPVRWAEDGLIPRAGFIYLVPPGYALDINPRGLALSELAAPSVSWLDCADVLFRSAASHYGARAVGIVLSGMLPAGIKGLREIRLKGGIVMAQNEASSAYFDMPMAAADLGTADIIYPPGRLGQALAILGKERAKPEP